MRRLYRKTLKPFAVQANIHPYLVATHRRVRPGNFVKWYNRETLREEANSLYEFSAPETIDINPSPTDVSLCAEEYIASALAGVTGTYRLARPFVAEVLDGRILPKMGVGATDDYVILLDTVGSRAACVDSFLAHHPRYAKRLVAGQRIPRTTNPEFDLDTAVSFIRVPTTDGRRKDGYSHWIQDYLTRLQGVEYYVEQTGRRPKILVTQNPPSWIVESLELLGYGDDIVQWNPETELRVRRLVVPSIRRVERPKDDRSIRYKVLSKLACDWLRETAVGHVDLDSEPSARKVFISRGDADRRRLTNHDAVRDRLQSQGFREYELTKLSFPEQVALFVGVEEIVGVHGAGLANMAFATDCTVTEITGDAFKPTYYLMATILGHDYQLVSGDSVDNLDISPLHQDIAVDPNVL